MTSFHNLIILGLGRGLQVVAGLVTIKLATTLLSPAEIGTMNQVMSLAILGPSALLAPVALYIHRGLFEWVDAGVVSARLTSYLLLVLTAAVILGLAAWALQYQLALVSGIGPVWVGALVALYLLGYSTHTMAASAFVLLGYRITYVVFSNLAVWGGLAFAFYLSLDHGSPETWLLGIFGGFLVSSCSYVLLYRYTRTDSPSISTATATRPALPFDWQSVLMFAWPQALAFGLWWIQSQSYRFILDWVADIANVGLFAAGYMICSVPIQTFETLFNEFYAPTLFHAFKGQDAAGMARAWNAYARAYIPAVILFGSFMAGNASFLVKLVLGEQFQAVTSILIWAALTETMRAVSSSLHMLGVAKVDMTVNLLPVVVGAVVAPTMVFLLAPHDPLLGTAIALFVASGAGLATVIPVSYRALPVIWPTRHIVTALVLGLPLGLMGYIVGASLGELTEGKAVMALAVSGLTMLLLQYSVGKKWLRGVYPSAGACK